MFCTYNAKGQQTEEQEDEEHEFVPSDFRTPPRSRFAATAVAVQQQQIYRQVPPPPYSVNHQSPTSEDDAEDDVRTQHHHPHHDEVYTSLPLRIVFQSPLESIIDCDKDRRVEEEEEEEAKTAQDLRRHVGNGRVVNSLTPTASNLATDEAAITAAKTAAPSCCLDQVLVAAVARDHHSNSGDVNDGCGNLVSLPRPPLVDAATQTTHTEEDSSPSQGAAAAAVTAVMSRPSPPLASSSSSSSLLVKTVHFHCPLVLSSSLSGAAESDHAAAAVGIPRAHGGSASEEVHTNDSRSSGGGGAWIAWLGRLRVAHEPRSTVKEFAREALTRLTAMLKLLGPKVVDAELELAGCFVLQQAFFSDKSSHHNNNNNNNTANACSVSEEDATARRALLAYHSWRTSQPSTAKLTAFRVEDSVVDALAIVVRRRPQLLCVRAVTVADETDSILSHFDVLSDVVAEKEAVRVRVMVRGEVLQSAMMAARQCVRSLHRAPTTRTVRSSQEEEEEEGASLPLRAAEVPAGRNEVEGSDPSQEQQHSSSSPVMPPQPLIQSSRRSTSLSRSLATAEGKPRTSPALESTPAAPTAAVTSFVATLTALQPCTPHNNSRRKRFSVSQSDSTAKQKQEEEEEEEEMMRIPQTRPADGERINKEEDENEDELQSALIVPRAASTTRRRSAHLPTATPGRSVSVVGSPNSSSNVPPPPEEARQTTTTTTMAAAVVRVKSEPMFDDGDGTIRGGSDAVKRSRGRPRTSSVPYPNSPAAAAHSSAAASPAAAAVSPTSSQAATPATPRGRPRKRPRGFGLLSIKKEERDDDEDDDEEQHKREQQRQPKTIDLPHSPSVDSEEEREQAYQREKHEARRVARAQRLLQQQQGGGGGPAGGEEGHRILVMGLVAKAEEGSLWKSIP